jgi:hypothetical protein
MFDDGAFDAAGLSSKWSQDSLRHLDVLIGNPADRTKLFEIRYDVFQSRSHSVSIPFYSTAQFVFKMNVS